MIFLTLKTSSCSSELSMICTPELNSPHTITTSSGSARVLMGSPVQKGLPPLHHSYIIVCTIHLLTVQSYPQSMFKSHLVTCARGCWGPAAASLQNIPRVSVFADVVTVSGADQHIRVISIGLCWTCKSQKYKIINSNIRRMLHVFFLPDSRVTPQRCLPLKPLVLREQAQG